MNPLRPKSALQDELGAGEVGVPAARGLLRAMQVRGMVGAGAVQARGTIWVEGNSKERTTSTIASAQLVPTRPTH